MTNTPNTEYTVHIPDELKAKIEALISDISEDEKLTVDTLSQRFAENIKSGKPMLKPPFTPEEIKQIQNPELRALAWDLQAITTAYNYASDPTLPDLLRDPPQPWITQEEQVLLETACELLETAYQNLYARTEDDFSELDFQPTEPEDTITLEIDTVYAHETHGDVLITMLYRPYDSYNADKDDGESNPVHINFTTEWDGYGPMPGRTETAPLQEFITGVKEKKHSPDFYTPSDFADE